MTRTGVWRWILACALLAAGSDAWAACTVSATGVAFGTYNVFSAANKDITGSITIRCRPIDSYTLSLSTGSGTYASRKMQNGIFTLNYNLYLNATRVTIWGNGTAGTGTVSGTARDATHTVYGRIPALQNARVGSYTDTIIVTITF